MMKAVVVVLCLVAAAVAGPPVSRRRSEIEEFRNFLESTRTEKGVRVNSDTQYGSPWENSGKFQGDILLDDEQVEDMVEQFASGRAAYTRPNTRWPGRVIPYAFEPGHFDNNQRNYILAAMRALESRTCIRFRPRNAGEFNHGIITAHNGCWASMGYWATRGRHYMNVSPRGCLRFVVIIHEWLHVIGFFHMQSAHNRYNYVRINWQNIAQGMAYNFYRFGPDLTSQLGLPYEHASCMHYSSHAFSTNGRPTIEATRPHVGIMGQLNHVTGWDLMRVDRHYGCQPWRTEKDYKPITEEDVLAELRKIEEANKDNPEADTAVEANEIFETKDEVPEVDFVANEVPEVVEDVPQENDFEEVVEVTET